MKITKITFSLGQTIQIKDFHPRNFHVSLEAELDAGEDTEVAHAELKKIAEAMIKKDVQDTEKKIKEIKEHANKITN